MASNARTLRELTSLSEDKLIDDHDALAKNTVVGISYYLEELRYRRQSRTNSALEKLTKRIYWLTVVVTVATIFNVGVAIWGSLMS